MMRIALYGWMSGVGMVVVAAAFSIAAKPATPVEPAQGPSPALRGAEPQAPPADPGATSAGAAPSSALPEPPPLPAPAPLPTPAPVSVEFDGVPASQIVGDRVNLHLATGGNVKSYAWSVMPPGTIGLKVYDEGAKADFTSRFPGTYVFLVAVAGADGSVAQAYHKLELRSDNVPPVPVAAVQAAAAPKPAGSDPSALVRQWAAEVQSFNRSAEQLQIASGFRQAAGAIDSGMFAGGDLFAQTKALSAASLGGVLGAWTPWFDKVEQLYRELERLKALNTPANFSAANKSVARALETGEK